jgi:hypothetical protein
MVQFGKKLLEHARQYEAELPPDSYVNYKELKRAIKNNCTADEFQELYNLELQRFVENLEDGLKVDPQYVEMNRLALDNISKKFDKKNRLRTLAAGGGGGEVAAAALPSLRKRNRARSPLIDKHSEYGERLHGWVYDPTLTRRVFDELDADSDGVIRGVVELQAGLRAVNLPLSSEAAVRGAWGRAAALPAGPPVPCRAGCARSWQGIDCFEHRADVRASRRRRWRWRRSRFSRGRTLTRTARSRTRISGASCSGGRPRSGRCFSRWTRTGTGCSRTGT